MNFEKLYFHVCEHERHGGNLDPEKPPANKDWFTDEVEVWYWSKVKLIKKEKELIDTLAYQIKSLEKELLGLGTCDVATLEKNVSDRNELYKKIDRVRANAFQPEKLKE